MVPGVLKIHIDVIYWHDHSQYRSLCCSMSSIKIVVDQVGAANNRWDSRRSNCFQAVWTKFRHASQPSDPFILFRRLVAYHRMPQAAVEAGSAEQTSLFTFFYPLSRYFFSSTQENEQPSTRLYVWYHTIHQHVPLFVSYPTHLDVMLHGRPIPSVYAHFIEIVFWLGYWRRRNRYVHAAVESLYHPRYWIWM